MLKLISAVTVVHSRSGDVWNLEGGIVRGRLWHGCCGGWPLGGCGRGQVEFLEPVKVMNAIQE